MQLKNPLYAQHVTLNTVEYGPPFLGPAGSILHLHGRLQLQPGDIACDSSICASSATVQDAICVCAAASEAQASLLPPFFFLSAFPLNNMYQL